MSDAAVGLVLASASPRRRELLTAAGYTFDVVEPDPRLEESFDATPYEPSRLVRRLALLKAENVADSLRRQGMSNRLVLACDSVAVCCGQLLGKPRDRDDAERMLSLLSGSRHEVLTGICLVRLDPRAMRLETVQSVLVMECLGAKRLESYLDSGLWRGKAGAFGYQDGNDWLTLESGSASNVIGLPLERFAELYRELTVGQ